MHHQAVVSVTSSNTGAGHSVVVAVFDAMACAEFLLSWLPFWAVSIWTSADETFSTLVGEGTCSCSSEALMTIGRASLEFQNGIDSQERYLSPVFSFDFVSELDLQGLESSALASTSASLIR